MKTELKLEKWTLGKWKREFWKVFSKYIRLRDKGVCITCGARSEAYQAGHCIPAGCCGLALYFNEKNVNGQCYRCNINFGGMGAVYRGKVDEKWGKGTYKELEKIWRQPTIQYTKQDYQRLIADYQLKISLLGDEVSDNTKTGTKVAESATGLNRNARPKNPSS